MHVEVARMLVEISIDCVVTCTDFYFQVWYIENTSSSPPGIQCSPISLYTVPV